MPPPVSLAPATSTAQKKRRIVECHIPLDINIPESHNHTRLVEAEQRLDALILGKKLEVSLATGQTPLLKRTLRIYMSNLYSPAGYDPDESISTPASWTFRIEGRLLHDTPFGKKSIKQPFLSILRALVVEISDPSGHNPPRLVEWLRGHHHQSSNAMAAEGFEIHGTLPSDFPANASLSVRVFLRLASTPDSGDTIDSTSSLERFYVAKELSDVIGMASGRRVDIVRAIWMYGKLAKLIQPHGEGSSTSGGQKLHCNATLSNIFNQEVISLHELPRLVEPYLIPVPPIQLDYVMRFEKEYSQAPHAYDVECWIPPSLQNGATSMTHAERLNDISKLEDQITRAIHTLRNARSKRDFMLEFSRDPQGTCNNWIRSQVRDLEEVLGEGHHEVEARRRQGYYEQAWVPEAVLHYFSKVQ